jgi:hypothetical protein
VSAGGWLTAGVAACLALVGLTLALCKAAKKGDQATARHSIHDRWRDTEGVRVIVPRPQ